MSEDNDKEPTVPPSEFKGPQEVGVENTVPEWDRAIVIRAKSDFTAFEIVDTFEFQGVTYKPVPGFVENILTLLSKHVDLQRTAAMASGQTIERFMNQVIPIHVPGQGDTKMTFFSFLANACGEAAAAKVMRDIIKRQIEKENQKGPIIRPGR